MIVMHHADNMPGGGKRGRGRERVRKRRRRKREDGGEEG